MRYPFLFILLLITIVMASRGDAAPLQNHGIKLFQHRQHILVGGQEITVEYHSAKNTITQKSVVYSLRIADKFNRQIYKRDYDIPFGVFSEEIYQNSVQVLPLVGDSGEGIAVFYSLGVGQDAIRKIDILGLRGKGPVLLGSKIELVPVVTQMPNHFLFPKTDKANIIKLSKGDRVLYRYWTGQMYIYFPVVIDWYGSLSIPSKSTEFRVEVPAFRKGGGRIMVHLKPTPKSALLTQGFLV